MEALRGPAEVRVMPSNTEQQSMMGNSSPTQRHSHTLLRVCAFLFNSRTRLPPNSFPSMPNENA